MGKLDIGVDGWTAGMAGRPGYRVDGCSVGGERRRRGRRGANGNGPGRAEDGLYTCHVYTYPPATVHCLQRQPALACLGAGRRLNSGARARHPKGQTAGPAADDRARQHLHTHACTCHHTVHGSASLSHRRAGQPCHGTAAQAAHSRCLPCSEVAAENCRLAPVPRTCMRGRVPSQAGSAACRCGKAGGGMLLAACSTPPACWTWRGPVVAMTVGAAALCDA